MTCFKSSGIGGIGSRRSFMEPSAALEMTALYFAAAGILVREILAEMAAAAFLAVQSRNGDGLGNREQMFQINGRVPAGVVFAMALHGDFRRAAP